MSTSVVYGHPGAIRVVYFTEEVPASDNLRLAAAVVWRGTPPRPRGGLSGATRWPNARPSRRRQCRRPISRQRSAGDGAGSTAESRRAGFAERSMELGPAKRSGGARVYERVIVVA